MKTMPAGKFKAHCLSVIDEVHDKHEEVIITKYGKPMARLVPLEQAPEKPDDIFGFMRGRVNIAGDIVGPIVDPEEWDDEVFPAGLPGQFSMILLDTHVALWVSGFPERLSAAARDAIRSERLLGNKIGISCASLYELAWGVMRGRIEVSEPLAVFFGQIESRFLVQQMTSQVATLAAGFPASLSGDPFDRIIAATALTEGIALVTADERIRRSGVVKTIW